MTPWQIPPRVPARCLRVTARSRRGSLCIHTRDMHTRIQILIHTNTNRMGESSLSASKRSLTLRQSCKRRFQSKGIRLHTIDSTRYRCEGFGFPSSLSARADSALRPKVSAEEFVIDWSESLGLAFSLFVVVVVVRLCVGCCGLGPRAWGFYKVFLMWFELNFGVVLWRLWEFVLVWGVERVWLGELSCLGFEVGSGWG